MSKFKKLLVLLMAFFNQMVSAKENLHLRYQLQRQDLEFEGPQAEDAEAQGLEAQALSMEEFINLVRQGNRKLASDLVIKIIEGTCEIFGTLEVTWMVRGRDRVVRRATYVVDYKVGTSALYQDLHTLDPEESIQSFFLSQTNRVMAQVANFDALGQWSGQAGFMGKFLAADGINKQLSLEAQFTLSVMAIQV